MNVLRVNGGELIRTGDGLRLLNPPLDGRTYCNAQLDDYQGLPRRRFPNRPPLRMTLRARFSHSAGKLGGTAGFGFWNDPFLMTGLRVPALPRALWFFYAAPPADMRLTTTAPGNGWKAMALDALQPRGLCALPPAALASPAMRVPRLYRRLWPWFERSFRIADALLDAGMTEWHEYALEWLPQRALFQVDGHTILEAQAPQGPLGLVIWIDNQYLVARPEGRLRSGFVAKSETQWMEIDEWSMFT
jgi:hypothetical protein